MQKTTNLLLASSISALYLIILVVVHGGVGAYLMGTWMGACFTTLLAALIIEKVTTKSETAGSWAFTVGLGIGTVLTLVMLYSQTDGAGLSTSARAATLNAESAAELDAYLRTHPEIRISAPAPVPSQTSPEIDSEVLQHVEAGVLAEAERARASWEKARDAFIKTGADRVDLTESPDSLKAKLVSVQRFAAVTERFKTQSIGAASIFEEKLIESGVGTAQRAAAVQNFKSSQRATSGAIYDLLTAYEQYADVLVSRLELLQSEWGHWHVDADEVSVVFDENENTGRFRELSDGIPELLSAIDRKSLQLASASTE